MELTNERCDDLAMNICQTEWSTSVCEGQLLMINAKLVQDSGLDVVNVDGIRHWSKT